MSRSPQEEIRGKIAKDHKDGGSKNIDNDVKDAFKGRKSPFIIVDSRETSSGVVRTLSELNANIELKKIPIGDYIVSKRCGVERKSMDDFVDSIKDGRLFKEIKKLGNQFSRPILILEGDVNSIVSINRAAILGTITSIMLNMHIFLYQTVNERNTAEILIALAKKEQEDSNKTFSIRFKKSPENLKEKLEYIVAGIPDINVSRARDLLEGMGSIQAIFNASEQELRDVYNIGPKIAKKIRKYAKSEYKFS